MNLKITTFRKSIVVAGYLFNVLLMLVHGQTVISERQPQADLGNGFYQNPIIPGRFADPTVVRVGSDYYMTHSMGGTPSLLIWHSKDLVNWEPLDYAAKEYYGDSWAPDLSYVNGKFYLYTTFVKPEKNGTNSFENYVLIAEKPSGPWSEPINLNVPGKIDPGHLETSDGKRYLFFNKGTVYELDKSGTKTIGGPEQVYEGWQFPDNWVVECFCLESPKLFFKEGFYYLVSAQGGTSGPATSHMSVVARSRSPLGPYENSPYNPLIKTISKKETWWSQGHSTLVEGPKGQWYSIHHGYENGFRHIGRQTLMIPIEWSDDGWPINHNLDNGNGLYRIPFETDNLTGGMLLSDAFNSNNLGHQWRSFSKIDPTNDFKSGSGKLEVSSSKVGLENALTLGVFPVNKSYEVQIEVQVEPGISSGLVLASNTFNSDNPNFYGIGLSDNSILIHHTGKAKEQNSYNQRTIHFKLRNYENDVILYYSENGYEWEKAGISLDVTGIKSLAILLYTHGIGKAIFRNFKYLGLQ